MTMAPESTPIHAGVSVWDTTLQPAGCGTCGRGFLMAPDRLGQPCPTCGRGSLESRPALMRQEPPELVVPFARQPEALPALFEGFVRGVWLRSDDFSADALARRAVPVFWPMWLVDGKVVGAWEGELGFDYQVESARDSLANGQWRSEKVVETRIRWEPRAGQLTRAYENVATPALKDHARWLARGGAYPEAEPLAYAADTLGQAAVIIPDLVPEQAWPLVKSRLDDHAAADCAAAAGAQHVRRIALTAEYPDPRWTQLLLPAYLSFYTDDAGVPQLVVVNGATGHVGGRRLASQRKGQRLATMLGVAAALALVLGLALLAAGVLVPPVALLGGLILIGALALGIAAIVPAVWPWQWNRSQGDV